MLWVPIERSLLIPENLLVVRLLYCSVFLPPPINVGGCWFTVQDSIDFFLSFLFIYSFQ